MPPTYVQSLSVFWSYIWRVALWMLIIFFLVLPFLGLAILVAPAFCEKLFLVFAEVKGNCLESIVETLLLTTLLLPLLWCVYRRVMKIQFSDFVLIRSPQCSPSRLFFCWVGFDTAVQIMEPCLLSGVPKNPVLPFISLVLGLILSFLALHFMLSRPHLFGVEVAPLEKAKTATVLQ